MARPPHPPGDPWDQLAKTLEKDLAVNIERVVGALSRGVADHLERTVDRTRERRERERQTREEREEEQRRRRREARARRREERYGETSTVEGWMFVLVAFVLFALGLVVRPQLWWLVFPAILMGLRGARILGYHAGRKPLPASTPPGAPPVTDPREQRFESVCDRILAAVAESPDQVRAFLGKPEQTVEQLRGTSRDLLRRERALRALVSPEEEARLAEDRTRLRARVEAEPDAIAKSRFAAALDALEQQLARRAELRRHADRLEAEHTRLAWTLEGLYTEILRLRSADASNRDLAGAGMRRSLDELRRDMAALADALDEVNRVETVAVPPPGPDEFSPPSRGRTPTRE